MGPKKGVRTPERGLRTVTVVSKCSQLNSIAHRAVQCQPEMHKSKSFRLRIKIVAGIS